MHIVGFYARLTIYSYLQEIRKVLFLSILFKTGRFCRRREIEQNLSLRSAKIV